MIYREAFAKKKNPVAEYILSVSSIHARFHPQLFQDPLYNDFWRTNSDGDELSLRHVVRSTPDGSSKSVTLSRP